MRRNLFVQLMWWAGLSALVCFCSTLRAQTILWETFDEYDEDSGLIGQEDWEGWDLGGADGTISSEQASSDPHSLRLSPGADIVQVVREVSSGRWTARAQTYVTTGLTGNSYFILLNTYEHGGPKNWSTQVRLSSASVTSLGGTENGRPATSTLPTIRDRWVEVRVEIDLDEGTQEIWYGGELLDESHAWQTTGVNEIQCVDLFSENADGFFFDDVGIHAQCEIDVSLTPRRGVAPLEVTFDASGSECPESEIETFAWDFGDDTASESASGTHTYESPGIYLVELAMEDEEGVTFRRTEVVEVGCETGDVGDWTVGEVGEPALSGCVSLEGDCVNLLAGGEGIGRVEDNVSFAYREVSGDFSAVVRVSEVDWPGDARVGILARESLEPDARMVFAQSRNSSTGTRARLERRRTAGGTRTGTQDVPSDDWIAPNMWVRLDRVGEDLTSYWSIDGEAWEEARDTSISGLGPEMLVGLSASPGGPTALVDVTSCDFDITISTVQFRRGDGDDSGSIELTDAVKVLNFLFLGGQAPVCLEAADADDSGTLELTDGVLVLNFLFLGGAAPADPGPEECGSDPEDSTDSGCDTYTSC